MRNSLFEFRLPIVKIICYNSLLKSAKLFQPGTGNDTVPTRLKVLSRLNLANKLTNGPGIDVM